MPVHGIHFDKRGGVNQLFYIFNGGHMPCTVKHKSSVRKGGRVLNSDTRALSAVHKLAEGLTGIELASVAAGGGLYLFGHDAEGIFLLTQRAVPLDMYSERVKIFQVDFAAEIYNISGVGYDI